MTRRITGSEIHSHATEAAFGLVTFTVVVIGWLVAELMSGQQIWTPRALVRCSAERHTSGYITNIYVDEFYNRVVIQPYLLATRALAWFDSNIIDGVVNLAARIVVFMSWLWGCSTIT